MAAGSKIDQFLNIHPMSTYVKVEIDCRIFFQIRPNPPIMTEWRSCLRTPIKAFFGADTTTMNIQWVIKIPKSTQNMMTSSNGNIFHVTGHLCREFTAPGEFPAQRQVTRSFDVFLICARKNDWVNNRKAGDLRRRGGQYDVNVMICMPFHISISSHTQLHRVRFVTLLGKIQISLFYCLNDSTNKTWVHPIKMHCTVFKCQLPLEGFCIIGLLESRGCWKGYRQQDCTDATISWISNIIIS